MIRLTPGHCSEILLLGAHCDDVPIGAGGTLLQLCRANPGLSVRALILSGAGTVREAEEREALDAFCPKARLEVAVLDMPDGRLPAYWERTKEALEEVRRGCEPDLILAPTATDAHQDHRGLAKLVPTVFRDHMTLGYEILKWESDLLQPEVFVPLDESVVAEKIDLLRSSYPSQHDRSWFDDETFRGLARVRGVQAGDRYAEGFHTSKLTLRF
ncbi:PIG-L family deacetylase [Spirillospora sp. NPDC052269]